MMEYVRVKFCYNCDNFSGSEEKAYGTQIIARSIHKINMTTV